MLKSRTNILLFFGSFIALLSSVLTSTVPGLAHVTIHTFSEFPREQPTPFASYPPLEPSLYEGTIWLAMASTGCLLILLSLILANRKAILLSAAGLSLCNIFLLIAAWPTTEQPTLSISNYYIVLPWAGIIGSIVGMSIAFTCFVIGTKTSRMLLFSVPLILALYLATPILIFTSSLNLLVPSSRTEIVFAILLLASHLSMVAGVIIGVRRTTARNTTTVERG